MSPILFNLCVNSFLRTITETHLASHGFSWGKVNQRSRTSWLQYADDAVAITPDIKTMQQLLSTFESWGAHGPA
jgi:hypothetical protein